MIDPLASPLAGVTTVSELGSVVRTLARNAAQAQGATFVVAEGDQCFYVDEDAIAPLWRGQRFPQEQCISGWAMIHGRTAVIPDTRADERIPQAAYRPTFVRALVMTPVGHPARAAIGAYWAHRHEPSRTELRALAELAEAHRRRARRRRPAAATLDAHALGLRAVPAPCALCQGAGTSGGAAGQRHDALDDVTEQQGHLSNQHVVSLASGSGPDREVAGRVYPVRRTPNHIGCAETRRLRCRARRPAGRSGR